MEVPVTRLLTAEQMRALERTANAAGLAYAEMMERAGLAVATAVQELCPEGHCSVLVLVGPGNNGGDGLVAACYLEEWNIAVKVYIWRRDTEPDPILERVQALGIPTVWQEQDKQLERLHALAASCDVVVDALLGTGASGPLRGNLPALLGVVRGEIAARKSRPSMQSLLPSPESRPYRRPKVIAVDLPSGLNADSGEISPEALRADVTVTFAHAKQGLLSPPGAEYAGQVVVADIGIAADLAPSGAPNLITAANVAALLPPRPSTGHKGSFGSVMVLGGSSNYVGAPCLAARAAYRAGAGLVTLATPAAIHSTVAGLLPEATHLLLPHSLGALVSDALDVIGPEFTRYQALLVGPGLGRDPHTRELLTTLLAGQRSPAHREIGFVPRLELVLRYKLPPLIIDADGLNLLAELPDSLKGLPAGTILTPHPGEMARLLGTSVSAVNADRLSCAREAALAWSCTVILKGAYTVVADANGDVWVNPMANAALATAGSGDVLAGAIAGLRAQGCDSLQAALAGVYLHGLTGMLWSLRQGDAGLLACELCDLLPRARQRLENG